jgi:hypothetical protein
LAAVLLGGQFLFAKGVPGGRLDSETPEELDAAEVRIFFEEGSPIGNDGRYGGIVVLALGGDIKAFANANVLIKASAIGKVLEGGEDPGDDIADGEIGKAFVIDAGEREEAAVAAGLEGEDGVGDEAGKRNDAA